MYTKINGCNARMLSRFTNKDAHQEASARTRSFDLLLSIRRRRFKWLGHILRLGGERLVKLAVKVQFELRTKGGMFMDMPTDIGVGFDETTAMAQDRKLWRELSWCLGDVAAMRQRIRSWRLKRIRLRSRWRKIWRSCNRRNQPANVDQMVNQICHEVRKPDKLVTIRWQEPKKKKLKPNWTNKQRAQWARDHYELHHGKHAATSITPTSTPTTPPPSVNMVKGDDTN